MSLKFCIAHTKRPVQRECGAPGKITKSLLVATLVATDRLRRVTAFRGRPRPFVKPSRISDVIGRDQRQRHPW